MSLITAVYDTRSYDRQALEHASLLAGGAEVSWRFHDFRLSVSTAGSAAGAQSVCVFVNDHLDAACLETIAKVGVKHVALRCAGFNNVDLPAAKHLGLRVTRVPAYSPYAVAEHSLALLMTLNRKTHRAYNRVREQNFSLGGLVGFDLHGKTIGIAGTGKIGRIAAGIFQGLGMRVLAFDLYPDKAWAETHGVTYVDWPTLLRESDIVSLYLPLTPDTNQLLNQDSIALMKRGAYLINTSRGKLVDTTALLDALKSEHLGGVGLDVYEEEEGVFFEDLSGAVLKDDELRSLLSFPNVILTSHQAFLTREALTEIARVTHENLLLIASGKAPLAGTELGAV